jgi:hypothetical protein
LIGPLGDIVDGVLLMALSAALSLAAVGCLWSIIFRLERCPSELSGAPKYGLVVAYPLVLASIVYLTVLATLMANAKREERDMLRDLEKHLTVNGVTH